MAGSAATSEKPFAIRDAAGNVIYESAALYLAGTLDVVNSEASLAIGRGEAVIVDGTGSVFARWDYSVLGTDAVPQTSLRGKRTTTGVQTDIGYLGVALETFPVAAVGRVAAPGSMLCVKTTSAATLAAGNLLSSSATAGSVGLGVAVHGGVNGAYLGTVLKINQVASPGTGSTTQAGCLVSPC
jgi:hypothetical protein